MMNRDTVYEVIKRSEEKIKRETPFKVYEIKPPQEPREFGGNEQVVPFDKWQPFLTAR